MILAAVSSQTTSLVGLLIAVFAASLVEMVEALTIIVAVGATRGWRSAMEGAAAALGVLAVLVGGGGVALVRYTPIDALRVVAGSILLLLGLSWLRKAILRSAGYISKHDEDAIYARTVSSLNGEAPPRVRDTQGFVVAFKGVFIEGMEVVLIVIGLGASQHRIGWAALAAGAAALLVAGVGALVVRQLSEVPENLLKTIVGIMLTSFGTFWVGEGAGVHWPGSDIALLVFVAGFVALTVLLIAWTRRGTVRTPAVPAGTPEGQGRHVRAVGRALVRVGAAIWDFLVGDTPEILIVTLAIVGITFAAPLTSERGGRSATDLQRRRPHRGGPVRPHAPAEQASRIPLTSRELP